jgi:hypothetical protein
MPPIALICCVAAKQAASYFGPRAASAPVKGATTPIASVLPDAVAGEAGTASATNATASTGVSLLTNVRQ